MAIEEKAKTKLDGVHFEENDSHHRGHRRRRPKKVNLKCPICESGQKDVTYKDVYLLKKFTSVKGKIISTEKSGVCSKHQRQLTRSIKRARYAALLPFVAMD